MNLARLEMLVASHALEPQTSWYAVDASVWPRCDAETSPERGFYHHPYRHSHGQPIVAGGNYSWRAGTTRGGRELLVASATPAALLELDRAPARPTHHPWREPQSGRGGADPLLARAGWSARQRADL